MKPTNGSFIFKLFSKGDQLKVKLANLKFPKLEMDPSFYYWGGLVIGGRDYSYGPYDAICFIENCHWINANELVDFEVNVGTPSGCKIGCIISMSSSVFADARFKSGFYSVRFGSTCQSFLSRRIKFWFNSSPDPGAFQGLFKGPLKSAYCVKMFLHSGSDAVCLS